MLTGSCLVQDDEAALMAELARIKKERAEEAARKAAEEAKVRQTQLQAEVAGGNPLINQNIDFAVRRCLVSSAACP